ncbi:LOW QUALITY PROTEIN: hypothetical protein HMPREF0005_05929, partial [Achromobacter xylosoxidans C54]
RAPHRCRRWRGDGRGVCRGARRHADTLRGRPAPRARRQAGALPGRGRPGRAHREPARVFDL